MRLRGQVHAAEVNLRVVIVIQCRTRKPNIFIRRRADKLQPNRHY